MASVFGLKPSETDYETNFFGLLSIVYSVFTGQTFLFLYERQMNIAQETYGEVFALELLVQQTFVACEDPEYRALMAMYVRQYMIEEVYNPADMESPFKCGGTYMNILSLLVGMQVGRERGYNRIRVEKSQNRDASQTGIFRAQPFILPLTELRSPRIWSC